MSNSSPTIDHGHLQNKKYSDDQRGTASKFSYRRQECVTRQHFEKKCRRTQISGCYDRTLVRCNE